MPGREPQAERWTVAAVQLTATDRVERNLRRALEWVRRAADARADLVALPENFVYLHDEARGAGFSTTLDGDIVASMGELAGALGCHVLLGSIPERIAGQERVHNTSVLIGPDGRRIEHYRKMHLFDIDIPGGVTLEESRRVAAGSHPVVAETRLGRLGLSVCYDLRFPELYRRLALAGAQVLCVPAAFTAFTGPAHWLPLLRARAIENQCWVVAPAQVGRHNPARRSHGETAVIDPWGRVVARRPRGEGIVMATVDLEEVARVRRGLPCLQHVRRELLGLGD